MDIIRKMKEKATKEANAHGGLTDEQRDEVRALLGKYVRPAKKASQDKLVPDPLRGVAPGTTIEMSVCVGEARQHRVIRETRICLMPFLLDRIETTPEEVAMAAQQTLGGEVIFEKDTVVIKLDQGRPVASVRIGMHGNVVHNISFEVA